MKKKGKPTTTSNQEIPPELIDVVCRRLARNQRVRRTLPAKGRLHIDRQLPFLCLYRRPGNCEDAGTERLVKGEASYLVASGAVRYRRSLSNLVREVVKTLAAEFGAFLVVEVWAAVDGGSAGDPAATTVLPAFTVHAPATAAMAPTIEALERRLKRVKVLKQSFVVNVIRGAKCYPSGMQPVLNTSDASELNCSFIGVAVPPAEVREGQLHPRGA